MAADYTAETLGYPGPPPPGPQDLPPGHGALSAPHPFTFASLFNQGQEFYRWSFDEALRHNVTNALAMRRDPVIMSALEARQMPVAQLSWHIDPEDETDPAQAEAAQLATKVVKKVRDDQWFKMSLLEAVWYGRSANQITYRWDTPKGRKRLTPVDWEPVNGDKLRFKWDRSVGVMVNAMFPGDRETTDLGFVHWLDPSERQQFVVHRHKPEDADWREGEFAGQLQGVGLRSRLYWWWWLKSNFLAMLSNYMQRFANGLTLITYDAHNPKALEWATAAARQPWNQAAFMIPVFDLTKKEANSVQRIDVGTASPTLMLNLVTEYFDSVIKEYILGQNLTSSTAPTGLGSGVAEAHTETLSRIVKFDAQNLDATIQRDLVDVVYRWSFPQVPVGIYQTEVDTPNAEEVLGNAQILYNMGLELDEEDLRDVCKLPKPKPGKGVISKIAQLQATAVGQTPDGVPSTGPAGPPGMAEPQGDPATDGQPQANVPVAAPLAYRRRLTKNDIVRLRRRLREKKGVAW